MISEPSPCKPQMHRQSACVITSWGYRNNHIDEFMKLQKQSYSVNCMQEQRNEITCMNSATLGIQSWWGKPIKLGKILRLFWMVCRTDLAAFLQTMHVVKVDTCNCLYTHASMSHLHDVTSQAQAFNQNHISLAYSAGTGYQCMEGLAHSGEQRSVGCSGNSAHQ